MNPDTQGTKHKISFPKNIIFNQPLTVQINYRKKIKSQKYYNQNDTSIKQITKINNMKINKSDHIESHDTEDIGRSYSIKTANSSFEMEEEFKYLGTNLTIQNYIQEEIKFRLKSGNSCYYLVQNILSSSLLSKNLKIKI